MPPERSGSRWFWLFQTAVQGWAGGFLRQASGWSMVAVKDGWLALRDLVVSFRVDLLSLVRFIGDVVDVTLVFVWSFISQIRALMFLPVSFNICWLFY